MSEEPELTVEVDGEDFTPAGVSGAAGTMASILDRDAGGAFNRDLASALRLVASLALMVERLAELRAEERRERMEIVARLKALEDAEHGRRQLASCEDDAARKARMARGGIL